MLKHYFSTGQLALWVGSMAAIVISFAAFAQSDVLTLAASLIGVTALIFSAKGSAVGQMLIIGFSVLYGIVSWRVHYYGEVATYLGMTTPMAVAALISWLRHPYAGGAGEVQIQRLTRRAVLRMLVLTGIVTAAFFWILGALGTAQLAASTVSVTTSFLAAWLTYERSEYFALAYAANDVVLIVLWAAAAVSDRAALAMLICFIAFLLNDLYAFWNWRRMASRQQKQSRADQAD